MYRKILFVCLVVTGVILLASCAQTPATPTTVEVTRIVTQEVPVEVTKIVEVKPAGGIPYEDLWKGSGHNDVAGEPFRHWDDATANPDGVPTSCAKCHSSAGYLDFLGADGSEAGKVDKPVPAAEAQGIVCTACHDPAASSMTSVAFPGKNEDGEAIVVSGLGDAARCMQCHQGRESKASVDGQIERFAVTDVDAVVAPIKDQNGNEVKFGFRNVHYFAAAATLYGTQVKGGYEYDGKAYDYKHDHVAGYDTCIGCHDPHSLKVKVDECAVCHGDGVKAEGGLQTIREPEASFADYDGDGNIEEGMAFEIQGLQEILLAQIQTYATEKAGAEIKYDGATYPYFMGADGKAYPNWTARLLKAAYNYQVSIKDPGAFAHGNKYIVQLLYDSIEDLGGDVSKLAREDAGHFAGDSMAFRDWDGEGEVPYRCAKCHSATGLPEFLKNGGSVVFSASGTTLTAGVGAQKPSNGFACSTCHNEADWPNRYAVTSVPFPSGKTLTFSVKAADGTTPPNDSNLCIECHQGRESTNSVNAALRGKDEAAIDKAISFKNIHYFAAGATLFGSDAAGIYQYAGKEYVGRNTHGEGGLAGPNECVQCHATHELGVKLDTCETCHKSVKSEADLLNIRVSETDYDGDGDVTEGIAAEFTEFQVRLYAAIQAKAVANGAGIVYNPNANPYWFLDKDGDGKTDKNDQGGNINYNGNWSPELLKAAYNYQYSVKDPGAFAHNPKYVLQALYDSIEALGGDLSGLTRP
ncbi:MAG: hypothetical protein JNK29_00295 [Anaerolineales bacterium]|nr:hypothetical protein [Anaerolineales bacterium]